MKINCFAGVFFLSVILILSSGQSASAEMVKKVINGRTVYVESTSSKDGSSPLDATDEMKDVQTEEFKKMLEERRLEEERRQEEEAARLAEEERRRQEEATPEPELRPTQGRDGYECPDNYYCRAANGGIFLTCIYDPQFINASIGSSEVQSCNSTIEWCREQANASPRDSRYDKLCKN